MSRVFPQFRENFSSRVTYLAEKIFITRFHSKFEIKNHFEFNNNLTKIDHGYFDQRFGWIFENGKFIL